MSLYPPNEGERLAAVHRYEILDTPPDKAFDRVAALAAHLFNVPIAVISIVDQDRIWFKSHYGLEIQQIDRNLGLCAPVILQNDVYSVIDASIDPRTLANPLVTGEFNLRFYAAAPLQTSDGFNLGTICVIDSEPRSLSEVEKAILQDLAAVVIDQLELRLSARKTIELEIALRTQALQTKQAEQVAKTDALTGLLNRRAFDQALTRGLQTTSSVCSTIIVLIDIDGFKAVNDLLGHQQGDLLLQTFGRALQHHFRASDTSYRIGGDEFALLLSQEADKSLEVQERSIRSRMFHVMEEVKTAGFEQVSVSLGIATTDTNCDPQEAVRLADTQMYLEKQQRKNHY